MTRFVPTTVANEGKADFLGRELRMGKTTSSEHRKDIASNNNTTTTSLTQIVLSLMLTALR
jgi:hypothetical protein